MRQTPCKHFGTWERLGLGMLFVASNWVVSAQPVIHLKNRTFTAERDPQAFRGLSAKSRNGQGGHYIVQFDQPPQAAQLLALKERGAAIIGYVPENAVMVSIPGQFSLDGLDAHWALKLCDADF